MDELENRILEATISIFAAQGLKFTMDDIAKELKISKKTLYAVFSTKEELLLRVVDYCFTDIKLCERKIAENNELDVVDKLRQIMIAMPDRYQNIGLSSLNSLSEKYPNVYKRVEEHLATDWEATISIINQGISEGRFKPFSVPIMQSMFESTIQSFMATDVLVSNGLTYEDGLQQLIDIILKGILI